MAPPSPKSSRGPAQVKTDRGWCTDQGAMATGSIADRINAFNKLRGRERVGRGKGRTAFCLVEVVTLYSNCPSKIYIWLAEG